MQTLALPFSQDFYMKLFLPFVMQMVPLLSLDSVPDVWLGLQKKVLPSSCRTTLGIDNCDGVLEWTSDSESFVFYPWMQVTKSQQSEKIMLNFSVGDISSFIFATFSE